LALTEHHTHIVGQLLPDPVHWREIIHRPDLDQRQRHGVQAGCRELAHPALRLAQRTGHDDACAQDSSGLVSTTSVPPARTNPGLQAGRHLLAKGQ